MEKGKLLDKALIMATTYHHGQYDRGGNPYILHCLKVMHYLKSDDEELQCIALLHDIVEDTNCTYEDLAEAGFTDCIINAVKCLTKVDGQSYDEYKERVFSNVEAMLVKKADLRHNTDIRRLKGVREKDIARVAKYHQFYLDIEEKLK